jgi:glycine/D-amino acid oxidase-like deaminating enzyme
MTTGRAWRAERRALLRAGVLGAAAGALAGCARRPFWEPPPVTVDAPGRALGHALRERWRMGPPTYSDWRSAESRRVDVAIVGGGIAGLACAWRLHRAGLRDAWVLAGPEPLGNAAGTSLAGTGCPTGAHYLPLPSLESSHVRELLAEAGVLLEGVGTEAPLYDERALVHAPSHRLLVDGLWQPGPLPALDGAAQAQADAFLAHVAALADERGRDGRRAFVVPVEASSRDAPSRALDATSAAAWLDARGWTAAPLRAWLEYVTRDEFGATPDEVSAWALVHYFAARHGRARNAEPGAVLTWPDGLAPLGRHLMAPAAAAGQVLPVSVERIERTADGLRCWAWSHAAADGTPGAGPLGVPVVIHARRVVVATPLAVAERIVPELADAWPRAAPARRAPWTVANVVFRRAPDESRTGGEDELAWDSVVHGSPALGFVHARHQEIRLDPSGPTVLTAYRAYAPSDRDARAELDRLSAPDAAADARAWLELVGLDIERAYGTRVWRDVLRLKVTVRGHGMVAPAPGFLDDARLAALRAGDGPLRFAHSDLSGYSVFEEALWWGVRAAEALAAGR